MLPDAEALSFMRQCLAFFADIEVAVARVMTDNGPGPRIPQRGFSVLLTSGGVRYLCVRPLTSGRTAGSNTRTEHLHRGGSGQGVAERGGQDLTPSAYLEHYK